MNGSTGTDLAIPQQTALAPAPRAVIDYDFENVLAAPPKQRMVLWLLAGIIASLAIALAVSRVDIIIAANGKVVSSESEIVVQPLETSVVRSIDVKMGQRVTAGTLLATLDPTFTDADESEMSAKLRQSQAAYDRLAAEIGGHDYNPADPNPEETTQRDIFRKRHDEITAKLTSAERKVEQNRADLAAHRTEAEGLSDQIKIVEQEEGMYKTLVAGNLASKLKLLDTTERLLESKSRLDTNKGEQAKLNQAILGAAAERDALIGEWDRKLSEEMAQTRSERDAAAARLSKARLRHQMAVMRATRDATVLEVAERPAGSVVREAEPLMRLVPADAPLLAEVQIDTRDVARLHLGDAVTIKFEALPWQQYGLAYGELQSITPDTVSDPNARETAENMSTPGLRTEARASTIHYRARVELTKLDLRNLPRDFQLRPGMRLVADIKVGRRSVLNYILNPITRVLDESLREP